VRPATDAGSTASSSGAWWVLVAIVNAQGMSSVATAALVGLGPGLAEGLAEGVAEGRMLAAGTVPGGEAAVDVVEAGPHAAMSTASHPMTAIDRPRPGMPETSWTSKNGVCR